MLLAALLGALHLAAPAPAGSQPPALLVRVPGIGGHLLAAPVADLPTLVVRARGVDEVALADALRPRSGGAAVVLLRDAVAVDPGHTFVDGDVSPPELVITVILGDGRVFVRRASAPEGPRDAARLVAAMLAAIAGEALDPLPERGQSPALAPPEQVPEDMSEPPDGIPERAGPPASAPGLPDPKDISARPPAGAARSQDTSARPPVRSAPTRPSGHAPSTTSAPPPSPSPGRPELALSLDGAPVLGLGVPDTGLHAGGAGAGLHVLGARRWLVAATFRAAGSERDGFGLVRLRVGLSAGTWLRRGRFELRVAAGLGVEPWFVTRADRRVRPGASTSPAPLLGGHLRVTPSIALPGPFRLGLYAELAASSAPSGRAVRISLEDRRLFVLGGLEASLGLELALRLTRDQTGR